jgi:SAM-dependent methyltransferase
MSWRREVEALVGPPAGSLAIVVTIDARQVRCRIVPEGSPGAPTAAGAATLRASPTALPFPDASVTWVAVWFLGDPSPPPVRRALLAELARALAPAGTLVVVDHNRPRRRLAAIAAAVAMSPRPPGATPAAVWRRLAYPVAREAHAAGFVVERLRLAVGERVQVISARRART